MAAVDRPARLLILEISRSNLRRERLAASLKEIAEYAKTQRKLRSAFLAYSAVELYLS